MNLGFEELEDLAEWAYRAAGLEPDTPAAPLELARLLISGGGSVPVYRCAQLRTPARLARIGSDWRVYVRDKLNSTALRWLVAHECAEWILNREGYRAIDVEQKAQSLAARLIAPRPAAVVALRAGLDFQEMAQAFNLSQSSAVLRRAEVSNQPTVLVTPQAIYYRGASFTWGTDDAVRHMAACAPGPGIVRAQCTDNRSRVALRAEVA